MKTARRLLAVSAALVVVITTASAYLRLSQYGMGCVDWPACYGATPIGAQALSETSATYWIRVVHRVTATTAGLLFVAIALFWWSEWSNTRDRVLSGAPLVLALFLAWLGRITPSPLPAVTIGNLLGGMATLAVLWWLQCAAARQDSAGNRRTPGVARAAAIGLVLLFLQIALGGLASARFTALACPAFPACGAWAGAIDLSAIDPFVARADPGESARETLHMLHRLVGFAAAAYFLWLGAWVRSRGLRGYGAAVIALAVLQIGSAAAMVLLQFPLALAIAHNVIAALLIVALVSVLAEGGAPQAQTNRGMKGMQIIDARDLEPPEPFERVMEALTTLEPGGQIKLILNREPFPLYRVLQLNGYRHQAKHFPDGRFEILISERPK